MKKVIMFLFINFLFIVLFGNVSADQYKVCTYSYEGHEGRIYLQYSIKFYVNGDVAEIDKIERIDINVTDGTEVRTDVTNKMEVTFTVTESIECPESVTISNNQINSDGTIQNTPDDNVTETIGSSQCYNYKTEESCKKSKLNGNIACVWNKNNSSPNGGYCNTDNLLFVGCGGANDIPMQVPSLISLLINLLKIATPIILIFIGMISLVKALAASKEDEIKKAQVSLIKKLIAAAMVFFVILIVQFVISIVAKDDEEYDNFSNCLNCFLNNSCESTTYYKTNVSGVDYCTKLTTGERKECK